MKLLIFNRKAEENDLHTGSVTLKSPYEIRFWKPTWKNFIPPGKDKKYVLYWLFHKLGVFKNRDYTGIFVYYGQEVVCSLLAVPAHYKWPFMGGNDLQFTYVMTHPSHRGKGVAAAAILHAIRKMKAANRTFWYVTENDNTASVNLCTKLMFRRFGSADSGSFLKVVKLTSFLA